MNEKRIQLIIKRLMDVAVSLIMLILFYLFGFAVAILIKVTSPGPVFFFQNRPGQYGKIFKVYKFRTMKPGSEENDQRARSYERR